MGYSTSPSPRRQQLPYSSHSQQYAGERERERGRDGTPRTTTSTTASTSGGQQQQHPGDTSTASSFSISFASSSASASSSATSPGGQQQQSQSQQSVLGTPNGGGGGATPSGTPNGAGGGTTPGSASRNGSRDMKRWKSMLGKFGSMGRKGSTGSGVGDSPSGGTPIALGGAGGHSPSMGGAGGRSPVLPNGGGHHHHLQHLHHPMPEGSSMLPQGHQGLQAPINMATGGTGSKTPRLDDFDFSGSGSGSASGSGSGSRSDAIAQSPLASSSAAAGASYANTGGAQNAANANNTNKASESLGGGPDSSAFLEEMLGLGLGSMIGGNSTTHSHGGAGEAGGRASQEGAGGGGQLPTSTTWGDSVTLAATNAAAAVSGSSSTSPSASSSPATALGTGTGPRVPSSLPKLQPPLMLDAEQQQQGQQGVYRSLPLSPQQGQALSPLDPNATSSQAGAPMDRRQLSTASSTHTAATSSSSFGGGTLTAGGTGTAGSSSGSFSSSQHPAFVSTSGGQQQQLQQQASSGKSSNAAAASPSSGGAGGFAARLLRKVSSAPDTNKLYTGSTPTDEQPPPLPFQQNQRLFVTVDGRNTATPGHLLAAAAAEGRKIEEVGAPIQGVIDTVHGGITLPPGEKGLTVSSAAAAAGGSPASSLGSGSKHGKASSSGASPGDSHQQAHSEWPTFPGSPVRMDATATSFSSKDFERGYAAGGKGNGLGKGRSMISFPGSKKRDAEKQQQRNVSAGNLGRPAYSGSGQNLYRPPTSPGIMSTDGANGSVNGNGGPFGAGGSLAPPSPGGQQPNARGSFRRTYSSNSIKVKAVEVGPNSFSKVKMLGKGDVGKVYLVREKKTEKLYAMKGECGLLLYLEAQLSDANRFATQC